MEPFILQADFWSAAVRAVEHNGLWIFIGFCVLAGTAKHLVGRILEHNERIAMIRAGMNPDNEKRKRA